MREGVGGVNEAEREVGTRGSCQRKRERGAVARDGTSAFRC